MSKHIPQSQRPYIDVNPKKDRKKPRSEPRTVGPPPDLAQVEKWVAEEIGKGRRARKLARKAFDRYEQDEWSVRVSGRKIPITNYHAAITAFIRYTRHKSRWSRFLRSINIFR